MTVKCDVTFTVVQTACDLHQDGDHVELQAGQSHSWSIDTTGDTKGYSAEELVNGAEALIKADVTVVAKTEYQNFWFNGNRTLIAPNETKTFSIEERKKIDFRIEQGKAPK